MRKAVVLVSALVALIAVNLAIVQREDLVGNGRVVLLPLAPVDPRSLMQGDYMALRFAVNAGTPERDGAFVFALDEHGVGQYVRIDDGAALRPGEVRLRYRVRGGELKFGTNAYFFQEGHAARYEAARFGEFRVGDDGTAILTGLRGQDREPLG